MKNLALALLFAIFAAPAIAGGYGACEQAIQQDFKHLIAPLRPVESVTKVSDEIYVLLVAGPTNKDYTTDSVVSVTSRYEPELLKLFTSGGYGDIWVGIKEGVDGDNDPALWMYVWADSEKSCVTDGVEERIYGGVAQNAPTIFWDAVNEWEKAHPGSALKFDE